MSVAVIQKGGRSFAGAYLGTADGAALPSAAGKTPGDYYVITTAGGGYSLGDMAVVNATSTGYDKVVDSQIQPDSTGLTTPASWRAAIDVVTSGETRRVASVAPRGGVYFDGGTTTAAIVCQLTKASQGTVGAGDFTVWLRFLCPTAAVQYAGLCFLGSSSSNNYTADSFTVTLNRASAGELVVFRYGANQAADWRQWRFNNFMSTYGGKVVDLVVVRSVAANDVKVYANGVLLTYDTETTAGANPTWDRAIVSDFMVLGKEGTNYNFQGVMYNAALYNRALSAADVLALQYEGIAYPDLGATCVPLISPTVNNGGFETAGGGGADVFATWTESTTGSSTITRDTTVFRSGVASCRFDIDGVGSGVTLTNTPLFVSGKRYRASAYCRGTAVNARLGMNVFASNYQPVGAVVDNASWQYRSLEFVASDAAFGALAGNSATVIARYAGANSGALWIDDFTLERIGVVCAPDLTIGFGRNYPDISGNEVYCEGTAGVNPTGFAKDACLWVTRILAHSDISSTAGTTKLFDLPSNCSIVSIELEVNTGFDAATTVNIGTAGSASLFRAATSVVSTGINASGASASMVKVSSTAFTPVYVQKNQATTTGNLTVSLLVERRM